MNIPLDAVRENGHNVRRVGAGAQADAALLDSIRAQGVLTPILVRREGDGYVIVAGHRRARAARAAGFADIPARVLDWPSDGPMGGHITAAQAAENMVRAPMHPVDQWRAIVRLQSEGFSLGSAAAALGMSERWARRLDRLGHLHEDVLELIEAHGMPDEHSLRIIAQAPEAAQKKALKGAVLKDRGAIVDVQWRSIASALTVRRIPRTRAIFDLDAVTIAWDEDLFAEPGSEDQFTTHEVDKFLAAQREALKADTAARLVRKERVRIGEFDEKHGCGIALPSGWFQTQIVRYGEAWPRTKTTEAIWRCVCPDGRIYTIVAVDRNAEREREKAAEAKARERKKAAATDAGEDEAPCAETDGGDVMDDVPAAAAKSPITKAGHEAIAAAKETALRDTLRGEAMAQRSCEDLLRLLILALGSLNLRVESDAVDWQRRNFQDLTARLLLPGGQVDPDTGPILPALAAEAIARIVVIRPEGRGSGDAAEWIASAIGADAALPRFDTAAFLARVSGAELRRLAAEAGMKPAATVAALREQCAGALPAYRPAIFGAPAPVVAPEDDDVSIHIAEDEE